MASLATDISEEALPEPAPETDSATSKGEPEEDEEQQFWDNHKKWCESVLQSPLDITVDSPEVVSGFKSYILYVSSNTQPNFSSLTAIVRMAETWDINVAR